MFQCRQYWCFWTCLACFGPSCVECLLLKGHERAPPGSLKVGASWQRHESHAHYAARHRCTWDERMLVFLMSVCIPSWCKYTESNRACVQSRHVYLPRHDSCSHTGGQDIRYHHNHKATTTGSCSTPYACDKKSPGQGRRCKNEELLGQPVT